MTEQPIRLTPRLCRAARALLGWRQSDLSEAAKVPNPTIEAYEAKPETARMMGANMRALVEAFERAGLEFIPENGGGAGIRFQGRSSPTATPSQNPKPLYDSEAERVGAERAAAERAERRINGTWTEADTAAEAEHQATIKAHERAMGGRST